MFSLFGIEETVKNVYMLSKKFIAHNNVSNTDELKPFYLEFLKGYQPSSICQKPLLYPLLRMILKHGHYHRSELIKSENLSTSAILNKKRPLDKVVHSIIVATEILLARGQFLSQQETKVHGNSSDLMKRTITAIEETMAMANVHKLLTERTCEMLAKARTSLENMASQWLANVANV